MFFALDFFYPVRGINLENSNTLNILRLENSQDLVFMNLDISLKLPPVPLFFVKWSQEWLLGKPVARLRWKSLAQGMANRGVWHKFIHFSPL